VLTDPEVRPAAAADVAAVTAAVHGAYQHYIARTGSRPGPLDADYAVLAARGELFVLGWPAIATVTLSPCDAPEGRYLQLENLAVAPDRLGLGLGRRLLAFADEYAMSRQCGEIRLDTHPMMWENQRLYTRCGFVEAGRSARWAGQEVVHYRRFVWNPAPDWDGHAYSLSVSA